jgi:dCTP diphosphatase
MSHGVTHPDRLVDVCKLTTVLETFAKERDWEQFHSPKNLVMALTGEVGELVEIFQWMTPTQSLNAASDAHTERAIKEELADVMLYLVRLASILGVDLDEAVRQKQVINAAKYPVDRAHGSSNKYSNL